MKVETLIDYLDHELSSEEEAKVELELETNAELQKALSDLCYQRFLWAEAYRSKAITVSPNVQLPVLKRKFSSQPPWRSNFSASFKIVLAAAIVLFFGLTIYVQTKYRQSTDQVARVYSRIIKVGPNVQLAQSSGKQAVTEPVDMRERDRVLVPKGSFALIKHADGSLMKLRDRSVFEIVQGTQGKYIFLHTGKLSAKIAPQLKDKGMMIGTPYGEITVLGTEFDINSNSRRGTYVHLLNGKISFRNYGDNTVLQLSDSEWVLVAPKTELTSGLASSKRYKDARVIMDHVFDPKLSQWQSANAQLEYLPDGMKLIPVSSKFAKTAVRIPSITKLPSNALAVEYEIRCDDPGVNMEMVFLRTDLGINNVPDKRLSKSFNQALGMKLGQWTLFRYEVDYSLGKVFPGWYHIRCLRGERLMVDQWKDGDPQAFQISVSGGSLSVRNFRVIERVEDPIEESDLLKE
jgi:hypothetical protein